MIIQYRQVCDHESFGCRGCSVNSCLGLFPEIQGWWTLVFARRFARENPAEPSWSKRIAVDKGGKTCCEGHGKWPSVVRYMYTSISENFAQLQILLQRCEHLLWQLAANELHGVIWFHQRSAAPTAKCWAARKAGLYRVCIFYFCQPLVISSPPKWL